MRDHPRRVRADWSAFDQAQAEESYRDQHHRRGDGELSAGCAKGKPGRKHKCYKRSCPCACHDADINTNVEKVRTK